MDERPETILKSRVSVPEHVVHREFAEETIVLNLESGHYHSLNRTAARMLEVLGHSDSIEVAVAELTREFGQPVETIERDVVALCGSLSERGLIEQHAGQPD